MRRRTVLLTSIALCAIPAISFAQTVPDGWTIERRDDQVTVTPKDLPPGQQFAVSRVRDEPTGGQVLRTWFAAAVDGDGARLGAVVKRAEIETLREKILRRVLAIRPRRGVPVAAIYLGGLSSTGRFELYRIVTTGKPARAHLDAVTPIIASWPSSPADAKPRVAGSSSKPPPVDRHAAYRTAAGKGIQPSEIAGFVGRIDQLALTGVVPGPAVQVMMLLKSGDYCSWCLELPPADLDVAAHQQAHPKRWGKWRRRGATYEILDDKRGWVTPSWERSPPVAARPSDELAGAFTNTSSVSTPSTVTGDGYAGSQSTLTFLPGKRFHDALFTGVVVTSSDAHNPGGRRGGAVATEQRDREGTYVLDGSTLELRYPDGRVERHSFLWMSAKKTSFFLGSAGYVQKKR